MSRVAVVALVVSNDHGEIMLADPSFNACMRFVADKSAAYGWSEAVKIADNFQRTIGWSADDLIIEAALLRARRRAA